MRSVASIFLLTAFLGAGCSDDSDRKVDARRADLGRDVRISSPDRASDLESRKDQAGRDAPAKDLVVAKDGPQLGYSDGGCLTYGGASQICGGASNGAFCKFSVSCGTSSSEGQCLINCEMGSTVSCYKPSDVTCVLDAFTKKSCSDLKACKWVL